MSFRRSTFFLSLKNQLGDWDSAPISGEIPKSSISWFLPRYIPSETMNYFRSGAIDSKRVRSPVWFETLTTVMDGYGLSNFVDVWLDTFIIKSGLSGFPLYQRMRIWWELIDFLVDIPASDGLNFAKSPYWIIPARFHAMLISQFQFKLIWWVGKAAW
jgi:hypothetical protein